MRRRKGTVTTAALLALLLALSFVIAGCGVEEDDDDGENGGDEDEGRVEETRQEEPARPLEVVQVANRTTLEAETARLAFAMNATGLPDGTPEGGTFSMTGEGVADLSGAESAFTMRLDMLGTFEVRQVGDLAYQKFPPEMLAQLPDAKPWVATDVDAFYEEQYGVGLSDLQTSPTDPSGQLAYLEDVGSVEEVGPEEVRGTPTTRYQAVMDLEAAAGENPEVRQAHEQMMEQLGTDELPFDVWLDDAGQARKMVMDLPVPAETLNQYAADPAATRDARVTMTYEFYDFGVPVDVAPPPPEETMTFEELQQQSGQPVS